MDRNHWDPASVKHTSSFLFSLFYGFFPTFRGTIIYLLGYKIIFTEFFWYPIIFVFKILFFGEIGYQKTFCKNNFNPNKYMYGSSLNMALRLNSRCICNPYARQIPAAAPMHPCTAPSPEEKSIIVVIYCVLLWATWMLRPQWGRGSAL